jgi:hypothetical protein
VAEVELNVDLEGSTFQMPASDAADAAKGRAVSKTHAAKVEANFQRFAALRSLLIMVFSISEWACRARRGGEDKSDCLNSSRAQRFETMKTDRQGGVATRVDASVKIGSKCVKVRNAAQGGGGCETE